MDWVDITERLMTPVYVQQDGGCTNGVDPWEEVRWDGVSTVPTGPALSKVGDRWVMPGDGGLHEICTDPSIACGCFGIDPIYDPIQDDYGKFCIPVGLRLDAPISGVHGIRLKVQMPVAQTGWTNGIGLTHYLVCHDFDSIEYWDPFTVGRDPIMGSNGIELIEWFEPADSTGEQTVQIDYINDYGDPEPKVLRGVSSILVGEPCWSECGTYRYGVYTGRPAMWVPLIQVWVLTDDAPTPSSDFWTDFVGCKELPT